MPRVHLLLPFLLSFPLLSQAAAPSFEKTNLAAWCIVPFDAKKRGPEERAAMLEKLGFTKFVYDYRAEHIPQWDDELDALKKHHIELYGWWFPTTLNDEARKTLELFKRHGVHPQLWVNGNGGSIEVKSAEDQKERIEKEVSRLKPICEAAAPLGCQVALYNHENWYGEPENALAIIGALQAQGVRNVGMVYNFHHGHSHLARIERLFPQMLPHLLCLNLNGMDPEGDRNGRKILPLGAGSEDLRLIKLITHSGYKGVIGILNHTGEDAEGRLQDNLDGLRWLVSQLDGKAVGPKPSYRTFNASAAQPKPVPTLTEPKPAPSVNKEFGNALSGPFVVPGQVACRTLPITFECRARLDSARNFNIIAAQDPKASATHWEVYSYKGSGFFSVYMPGRGGEFRSKINICDGKWHDLIANLEEDKVTLWVDGRQALEKAAAPLSGRSVPGDLAFGSLVEGGLGCDGAIDDVRLSRGFMKPRKGDKPRQRMDITLALWNFDDLAKVLAAKPHAPEPRPFHPERRPIHESDYAHWQADINRDRVFDYYGKEAVESMGKPLPGLLTAYPGLDGGQQGHWGNQNDAVTWRDGRFAASDLGTVFSTVFKGGGLTIPKAVCVRVGETGEMAACFDRSQLAFPIVWRDGFIKLSDARHGFMGGGQLEGKVVAKPAEHGTDGAATYLGFYRYGKHVVFHCNNEGRQMLFSPWVEKGEFKILSDHDGSHTIEDMTKGGPAQWPQWIETRGVVGSGAPFAMDTLTIPFDNPYGTLFFISGFDFFSDGTAAISTMTGEVWLVKGIDGKLEHLRWKRYATGLHQPLGVKIVKDKLYVLGRDQITCLHDLNGDDEADYYECVTDAMETSPGGHDFITGLDIDSMGRFYFASGNQGICRVAAPNQREEKLEVLATGFRNPNGLGLSPDARFITSSVQEGDWTPASSICQIEIGKNVGAHFGAGGPKNGQPPEPPLIQMPRGEDNSSGGQCFLTQSAWPALLGTGNLTHFSPGTGTGWLVMRQNVGGRWQGAAVRIAGSFDSGSQTGRFNPRDGHLYVTGMQGWGSYTPKDGCFQRLRYTASGPAVPIAFEARDNGVLLRFDRALDQTFAAQANHHFAQCWNYHYSAAYGSPEFSVRYPDAPGHDPLEIHSVQVLENGKALFLEIPQLIPASVVHLHVGVSPDRAHDIFMTAHALAPAFTDFPGYQKIAKIEFAHAAAPSLPPPAKPNPWAKGEPGRAITVDAALGLQYVQKQISAKPGERISLTFHNPDVVPHNWMLGKPGALQKLGNEANLLIADPTALARHYVPDSPDVIVYTDMTNPQSSFTIHFNAPNQRGDYPYLCTFPGHWMVMNGILKVK